jgi:DNA repair protein RecO (recombination protein O)
LASSLRQRIVTKAIVLRRVAYGEADWVVTLLGRETGHVSALARSARKSARRFAGGLGMAMVGEATLQDRPSGDLMALESFEVVVDHPELATDVAKTAHAAYAVELCDRLCPARHPDPPIFDWLEEFLALLSAGVATVERLRVFELGLLRRLGIGPSWDRCLTCGRNDLGDESVRFHAAAGGIRCRQCAQSGDILTGPARQALDRLGAMALADAGGVALDRDVSGMCRRTVLALLREHIHGPLRSLDFIEKMSGHH